LFSAAVVGRAHLACLAGAVVGAGVDPQQLVPGRDAVDEAQVAAAVHVVEAAPGVHGRGDVAHLREHRTLVVHGAVVGDLRRLHRELLLRAVEVLGLRAQPDRLRARLAGEPPGDERVVVETVVPDDIAVGVGGRVPDDDRVEVGRLQRGAQQRRDRRVRVAVERHVAVAPGLRCDPLDHVGDVELLAVAQQAQRPAALAAAAHVGVDARVTVGDVVGRRRAPVGLHVDHGRIPAGARAGEDHVTDEVDAVRRGDRNVGHLRVGAGGGGREHARRTQDGERPDAEKPSH
jgi:hypothetical protein